MFKRLGPGTRWFWILAVCLLNFVAAKSTLAAVSHTFQFDSKQLNGEKPKSVAVAGSFNGWSKDATPMRDPEGKGIYTATVSLSEGVVYYKFVVNGDKWFNDPRSDKELEVDDNYGGRNSAVLIGPDVRKAPPPKPNDINEQFLFHDPTSRADLDVCDDRTFRVRIRAQAGDVQTADIVARDSEHRRTVTVPLPRLASGQGIDQFGGIVELPEPCNEVQYSFDLIDGSKKIALDPDRFHINMRPAAQTPDWAKNAVWYQIFPERFRNGDPSNDPGDKEYEHLIKWTADWWKTQPGEMAGQENFYKGVGNVWKRRYGGDIQGVKWALPYLRSLGVTAIYFNPVFEADSMHKYDTADYRHIDEHFGVKGDLPVAGETDDPKTWKWSRSDQVFLDFLAEAHRQGFKVIVDGVFNHVGRSHPFFQDVVKNGKSSKYADWFEIEEFGDKAPADPSMFGKPGGMKFKAWDGPSGHLPVFRKDPQLGLAHGPREHVLAVVRRWLAPDGDPSKGVDGWRLDVPGDIPHPFWQEFRKVVKQTKPDAYISGEIWGWAQGWLQGDQFDAVMNYRFATACQDFFVNQKKAIGPTQFNQRLNEMIFAYPLQIVMAQQNLFDSHDTDRFASMFVNPDLAYDASNRIQDNGEQYKPDKPNAEQWARMKQAATFQMTFLGAPMIYYGDEAGMWSPDDPSNRQPMVWKDLEPYDNPDVKFNDDVFKTYRRAIAARMTLPALRTGFYRVIDLDDSDSVICFARDLDNQHAYVAINRSAQPHSVKLQLADAQDALLINWLDPAQADLTQTDDPTGRPKLVPIRGKGYMSHGGTVSIDLPPYRAAILSRAP
ncbi:MAG TPA: alpha-amylase family glycosyl hydrolase [Tepidisphaeraceae bacterium]|jgi:glycosidase